MVVRVLIVESVISTVNASYIAFFAASCVLFLNSLSNPIVYCVRIRQFRVAFIDIVFKKEHKVKTLTCKSLEQ